jgi:hypothetical protein
MQRSHQYTSFAKGHFDMCFQGEAKRSHELKNKDAVDVRCHGQPERRKEPRWRIL